MEGKRGQTQIGNSKRGLRNSQAKLRGRGKVGRRKKRVPVKGGAKWRRGVKVGGLGLFRRRRSGWP